MKQGNGTDVLGLNDPRNASIGVIYVSPTDEKKSVLAAILTQEKLGRKQVAVVLPEQNKAFQRPGDFDDLKSLRGKLQTQIIFIAAGGPGPAAFARQRNFPVYSTLEIFAKALKDEEQNPPESKKGGWLFGVGRQKPVTPPVEPAKPEVVQAGTFIAPLSGEEEPVSHNDHVVPLVLGGAEAMAASSAANGNGHTNPSNDKDASPTTATRPAEEDDWHILAPVAAASVAPTSEPASAKNGTNGSNGHLIENEEEGDGSPGIILLAPTRTKATVKLPVAKDDTPAAPLIVPVAKPAQQAPPPRATKQRNSGKVAAATVATGAAGGLAAASLARTAGVGSAPPPRANAPGGGGGGSGRPRRGALLAALAILLVLTTAFVSVIAISAPSLLAPLKNVVPKFTAQSTVNIVPDSKTENNNYLISGVTNNPDASKREVSARVVVGTSPAQSKTVNATGVKQTPATAATGTITLLNSFPTSQRIAVTTFSVNGASFANNASVLVGGSNPPVEGTITVSAHAVTLGSKGNLGSKTFYGSCCANGITAYVGPFSGGQDPQNYTFVQASDIQGAVSVLEPPLVTQAQNSLKTKINSNEQVAGSTTCSPSVAQNQNAGDKASSVTVTVTVTCKAEVYDQKGTLALVTNLLKTRATNDYGPNYALVGNIVTQAQVQGVNNGVVNLLVSAKGIWAYQFTDARQLALKKLIAGKSVADAATILKSQAGVANASFDPNSGTLPTNTDDIKFVIQTVTGLSGGGGTSGGGSLTPTVTGPGTNPTTQPGLGVGGGS